MELIGFCGLFLQTQGVQIVDGDPHFLAQRLRPEVALQDPCVCGVVESVVVYGVADLKVARRGRGNTISAFGSILRMPSNTARR